MERGGLWDANRREMEEALSEAFQIPLAGRFQDITANITLTVILRQAK